jgi:hypothetical protein
MKIQKAAQVGIRMDTFIGKKRKTANDNLWHGHCKII